LMFRRRRTLESHPVGGKEMRVISIRVRYRGNHTLRLLWLFAGCHDTS
jgi:hypothetical protein